MKLKNLFRMTWPILMGMIIETILLFTSYRGTPYLFTLTFFYFLIFGWLHIALHELGHLAFGLATGYRFLSYRLFTRIVVKEHGKLQLKRQKINEALAQCLMVPNEQWNPKDFPYQLYLSGGILFNALFALAGLLLLNTNWLHPLHAWLFFAIGMYMVFSNALPKQMNDGNILKKCRQQKEYRKMMYFQLRTIYYLTEGKQLSELPAESFALFEDIPLEDAFSLYVMRLEYYKYLEQYDFECAATLIERQWQIKDKVELVDRMMIAGERLFCLSIQKNFTEAKQLYYYQEIQHISKLEQAAIKRIFAAYYLFIEQDAAKAVIWCKAGLNLLEEDFFDNSTEVERNLLLWLKKQADLYLSEGG